MMRGLGAKFVACLSCTLFCFGVVNVSYGVNDAPDRVMLKWKLSGVDSLKYNFSERQATDFGGYDLDLLEVDSNPDTLRQWSMQLKQQPLVARDNLDFLVGRGLHNSFVLRGVYVDPLANEKNAQQSTGLFNLNAKLAGMQEWYVEFDQFGRNDFWFLVDYQQKYLSFYTRLPFQLVSVGSSWPLGVKLADLPAGAGYMADIQDKDHATLQNIYIDEAGRTVAEVSFFAVEQYQAWGIEPDGELKEGLAQYGVIGYGAFFVDEGYWSKVVVREIFNAGNTDYVHSVSAIWLK